MAYKFLADSRCNIKNSKVSIVEEKSSESIFAKFCEFMGGHIFVFTPSFASFKGYENALDAVEKYEAQNGEADIHIIDIDTASEGAEAIVAELERLEAANYSFDEIVGRIEVFKNSLSLMYA